MYEAEKKKNEKNESNIKKKDEENGKLTKVTFTGRDLYSYKKNVRNMKLSIKR